MTFSNEVAEIVLGRIKKLFADKIVFHDAEQIAHVTNLLLSFVEYYYERWKKESAICNDERKVY